MPSVRKQIEMHPLIYRCVLLAFVTAAIVAGSLIAIANASKAQPRAMPATQRYLMASEKALETMHQRIPESRSAIARLVDGIQAHCTSVVGDAPPSPEANVFHEEVAIAVVLAFVAPDKGVLRTFLGTVRNLSWKETRVAGLVARSIAEGEVLTSAHSPNVCKDLQEWATSRFTKTPKNAVQVTKLLRHDLGFALLEGDAAAKGRLWSFVERSGAGARGYEHIVKTARRQLRQALLHLGSEGTREIDEAVGWR
jgi:hypothetical protein